MRRCDCHGRQHREESLTALLPSQRDPDLDPLPAVPHGVSWFCDSYMRKRAAAQAKELRRGPGRREKVAA